MSFLVFILLLLLAIVLSFFLPKWLYWISPKAYSAYDVLSEQYGHRTTLWIIAFVVVIGFGLFFFLYFGSYAGW